MRSGEFMTPGINGATPQDERMELSPIQNGDSAKKGARTRAAVKIKRDPQWYPALAHCLIYGSIFVVFSLPPSIVPQTNALSFLGGLLGLQFVSSSSCNVLLAYSLYRFFTLWRHDRWRREATHLSVAERHMPTSIPALAPISVSIRPRWVNIPLLVKLGVIVPLQVLIALQLFSLGNFIEGLLFIQNSAVIGSVGYIGGIFLLLAHYGWTIATKAQRLILDDTHITLYQGRKKTMLAWDDINLCAVVGGTRYVKTYEVSSPRVIMRFDVLATYIMAMVPTQHSFAKYHHATEGIEPYITAHTGLPFFDLRGREGGAALDSSVIVPQET